MFKLQCFIEDRHLARVMHGLAGVARDLQVVPVVNAVPTTARRAVAKSNAGNVVNMLAESSLMQQDRIEPTAIKQFLKDNGFSPDTSSYLAKKAIQARLIKRHGKSNKTYYSPVKS